MSFTLKVRQFAVNILLFEKLVSVTLTSNTKTNLFDATVLFDLAKVLLLFYMNGYFRSAERGAKGER